MTGTDWLPYAQELASSLQRIGCFTVPWMEGAFFRCPRHLFIDQYFLSQGGEGLQPVRLCPLTEAHLKTIYADDALLIRTPPAHCSSSQPQIVFAMLGDLQIEPGLKVLEIGTGTGWNTALLACGVGDSSLVYSVEIQPDLIASAQAHLQSVGLGDTNVRAGDGGYGWAEAGPFDRIIATVGVPGIPNHWVEQLSDGGILLVPLEIPGFGNPILRIRRTGNVLTGEFTRWSGFYRCRGDFSACADDTPNRHRVCGTGQRSPAIGRIPLCEIVSLDFLFFLHTTRTPMRCMLHCQLLRDAGYPLVDVKSLSACLASCREPVLHICGDRETGEAFAGKQEEWIELGRPSLEDYRVEVSAAPIPGEPGPGEWADIRQSAALKFALGHAPEHAHVI